MVTPLIDTLEFKEITDEEYFSSDYKGYISNSRLSLINPDQGGSPEKYLANEHKTSSSLSLGSAVHALVLEPDDFRLADTVNKPTAKLGMMADYLYKYFFINKTVTPEQVIEASDAVDYYKGKMNDVKIDNVLTSCWDYWSQRVLYEAQLGDYKNPIFLDNNSIQKCKGCVKSIQNNTTIQSLLRPADTEWKNETALFMDFLYTNGDKECILKFKAKLDNFTIDTFTDSIVLNDLKTTGHYVDKFSESYEKYHYYRQVACYAYLLKLFAEKYYNIKTITSLQCNFLLVSTIPDYETSVFRVNIDDFTRGWEEFIKLMNMVGDVTQL